MPDSKREREVRQRIAALAREAQAVKLTKEIHPVSTHVPSISIWKRALARLRMRLRR